MLFAEGMPNPNERASLTSAQEMLDRYWGTLDTTMISGMVQLDYTIPGEGSYPMRTLLITAKSPWQAAAALIVEIERRVEPGDRIVSRRAPIVEMEKDHASGDQSYRASTRIAIIAERYRRT